MNKDYYISLIARKLANELNASQLKDLNGWLSANKSNAAFLDDFKTVWNNTGQYKKGMALDIDRAFEKFTGKYDIPKAEPSVLESFAKKKLRFSINIPLLFLLGISLIALLYFSGVFAPKEVRNTNMHAMTVQLDTYSSATLAPNSSFVNGKAESLSEQKQVQFSENAQWLASVNTDNRNADAYIPVETLFEPSSKNYIIEDFSGQGFFELKSINESQAFVGLGSGLSVGSRDVAFNLQNYSDENVIIIDVKNGVLNFYDGNGKAYRILKGERAIFKKDDLTLNHANAPDVNPFKWYKGVLVFDNTPLDRVFDMIEKYYGVNIEVTDKSSTDNINFTATMSMSNNLNDCLDLLHESISMDIKRIGLRQIEVSGISSN